MYGSGLPVVLAHGALGEFDEIIFLGIGAIFLVLMGLSWIKSRNEAPDEAIESSVEQAEPDARPDRFTLK